MDPERPGLQELISLCGLERTHLNRECPQAVTIKIAAKVIDWKMLGRVLGLQRERLEAIDRDCQTEDQRKVAMFDEWKSSNGSRATYLMLAKALYDRDRLNIVKLLLNMSICHETTPTELTENLTSSSQEQVYLGERESGNCGQSFVIAASIYAAHVYSNSK